MPKSAVMRRAVVFALAAGLWAAWPSINGQAQGQRQQPARDAAARQAQPAGTASISGRVLDYESGRPVKRARVSASAAELPGGRAATTDQNGAYILTELPAGRYSINVAKTGYVAVSYGQRRPLRTGSPLTVRDKEQVRDIDFRLPKGSVITGRVWDEDGEPLLGAQVRALRYQHVQGQQQLVPAGSGSTDDRGQYRIFGLQPGMYFVTATARFADTRGEFMQGGRGAMAAAVRDGAGAPGGGAVSDPVEQPQGYAPTYYPGVTTLSQAGVVTVDLTQEMGNIDFGVQLVPTARVSGIVTNPDGSAAANASVVLLADEGPVAAGGTTYSGRVQNDGTYLIQNVPPGRYVAVARGGMAGPGGRQGGGQAAASRLSARQSVTVAGHDLMGLTLALTPGATVRGSVVFESTETPPPTNLNQVSISAAPVTTTPLDGPATVRASADGTFALENVGAGIRVLRATGVSRPWGGKGIYLKGRGVSDTPLEFQANQRVSGVSVVFTDRTTEIVGKVPDGAGEPLLDYLVVAFSSNPAHWVPQSRRIQTARPEADGTYRLRGLPPGDYLLVAIDDAAQGEWYDPAFLDEVRKGAVRLTLVEGEVKSQDLRLLPW